MLVTPNAGPIATAAGVSGHHCDATPIPWVRQSLGIPDAEAAISCSYETRITPGGFHVPSPAGKIDGGSAFGQ